MLEIRSDNNEITVKTCNGESLLSQLNELRQVCAAAIGTIAYDHDLPMDKVMGGFLILLEEDDDTPSKMKKNNIGTLEIVVPESLDGCYFNAETNTKTGEIKCLSLFNHIIIKQNLNNASLYRYLITKNSTELQNLYGTAYLTYKGDL